MSPFICKSLWTYEFRLTRCCKTLLFSLLLPFSNTLTCKFTQWIYERILLKSHRSSPMTSSDWYPLSRPYRLTDRLKTAPLESLHVHEALNIYVYVGMIWAHSGRPRIVGIYLTCLLTVAAETRKVRGSSKLSRSSHEAAGATRAAILPE